MTRYLSPALFAEGASDIEFLSPLLYRITYKTPAKITDTDFEVAETFVRAARWPKEVEKRSDRVALAFHDAVASGAVNVLFIHADGGADRGVALADRINPCFDRLGSPVGAASRSVAFVPVVPVRETEAWALADGEALLREFGSTRSLEELGLPARPSAVETLTDPKLTLRMAIDASLAGRKFRRRQVDYGIPAGLADRIDLDKLMAVTAFAQLAADLETGLRRLWSL